MLSAKQYLSMGNTESGVLVCPGVIGVCPPISGLCAKEAGALIFEWSLVVRWFYLKHNDVLLAVNEITLFACFIRGKPYISSVNTNVFY